MRGYRSGAAQRTKTRVCRSRRPRFARAQKIPIRRAGRRSSDSGSCGGAQFKVPAATSAVITNGASAARVQRAAPQTASADETADPALRPRRWRGHQPCPVRRCAAAPQWSVATLRLAAADAWGALCRFGRRQRVPEARLGAALDSARPRGRLQSVSAAQSRAAQRCSRAGARSSCSAPRAVCMHARYTTCARVSRRGGDIAAVCSKRLFSRTTALHLCRHLAPPRRP